MKRDEEIKSEADFSYGGNYKSLQKQCFIEGAEWADKTMIEKACEWLTKHLHDYDRIEGYEVFRDVKSFVNDFRKAMEE